MATVYVTAFVPDAALSTAEGAIAPFLTGPGAVFTVPLVPLDGAADAVPTHWGCCAPTRDDSGLSAALPTLAAAFPGAEYAVVTPWRSFNRLTHWVDWLAARGLKQRVVPQA